MMVAPELTPLEHAGFEDQLLESLQPYWITSAEEFVSLANLPNTEHANGLAALAAVLGIDEVRRDELLQRCRDKLPPGRSYDAMGELRVGTGLVIPEEEEEAGPLSYVTVSVPDEHMLSIGHLPEVAQQGDRNTCVAFATAAMYQVITGTSDDLSEQFLFWACYQEDCKNTSTAGTTPSAAIAALQKYGICLEDTWHYVSHADVGDITCGEPGPAARQEALSRRISGGGPPTKYVTNSLTVRAALHGGQPVLIGLPIYPFWKRGAQGPVVGRVRMPLPGEQSVAGHAVCAVGYRKDERAPGGGYVIFRNSWGDSYGAENATAPGYGHVPYAVLDGLPKIWATVIDPPLGASLPPPQAASGGLVTEARAALGRAQAELGRLAEILARIERGER